MKIALYCHKKERCGIAGYTASLETALRGLGHEVQYFEAKQPWPAVLQRLVEWRPDVFHIQHEPSIMPPDMILQNYASTLRKTVGTKIVLTLHTENSLTVKSARRIVSNGPSIFLHRPSLDIRDATIIPMACPVFPTPASRDALREKYGFPKNAVVISSLGFMIPWKQHTEVASLLMSWMTERSDVHLQIMASEHFNPALRQYAANTRLQLQELSRLVDHRIHHVDTYPSEQELLERIYISDLGYVWCPFHTGSASAAGAMFTAARCPVVATDSTHYAHLGAGFVRVSKDNINIFAKMIREVVSNQPFLERLHLAQQNTYRDTNYNEVAAKHVTLYGRLAV